MSCCSGSICIPVAVRYQCPRSIVEIAPPMIHPPLIPTADRTTEGLPTRRHVAKSTPQARTSSTAIA